MVTISRVNLESITIEPTKGTRQLETLKHGNISPRAEEDEVRFEDKEDNSQPNSPNSHRNKKIIFNPI